MKRAQSRIIMGAAISAAAIAAAIDHTRHRLPEPGDRLAGKQAVIIIDEGEELPAEDACGTPAAAGKRAAPCSL